MEEMTFESWGVSMPELKSQMAKELIDQINDLLPPPYKVVYNAEKDLLGIEKLDQSK